MRKGQHGSLVVYTDRIRCIEIAGNGDEIGAEKDFVMGCHIVCPRRNSSLKYLKFSDQPIWLSLSVG